MGGHIVTRKSFSLLALACAGAFGMSGTAVACQTNAWDSTVGTVSASSPNLNPSVPRYSGACAAQAAGPGNYVQDDSPGAEPKYFVQFYLFTGVTSANDVRVFQADGAAPGVITVDYNQAGSQLKFGAPPGPGATINSIAANRWYMVQMSWDKQTNQNMAISVKGAGSNVAAVTATATGVNTGQIDTAKLGWISGDGTPNPGIVTDAFVSQRATAPGRLKRADADNSGSCNANDISRIGAEIIGGLLNQPNLSPGQPDCNEQGVVDANDISCTGQLVIFDLLNSKVCGD